MKRRSRAGGELTKGKPRKALEPKRSDAPKAVSRSKSSPPGEETEVARLTRERDEALEQRTAISDILRVISNSNRHLRQYTVFGPTVISIEIWPDPAQSPLEILRATTTRSVFYLAAGRHPAAFASSSVQNHRLPGVAVLTWA
jgi:hypothetical protein